MTALAQADERGLPASSVYVDGKWVAVTDSFERRCPADPAIVTGRFACCGDTEVHSAVEAADRAFPGWRATAPAARGAMLSKVSEAIERRADALARYISLETGKPLRESRGEVLRTAAIFRYAGTHGLLDTGQRYAGMTGGTVWTDRRPLGVVGVISPWNFPLAIPAWKAAPALALGNTVVIKVAQDSSGAGLLLAQCLEDADLPDGVANLLTGEGPSIGEPLIRHPRVRAISFTGSVSVGRSVRAMATEADTRNQLELGGHSPLVVMADADLGRAVEAAYFGAFSYSGQKCTATRRIFVERDIYQTFRSRLIERIRDAAIGDPLEDGTDIGPLINERQMEGVLEAVERGKADGGTLTLGGSRVNRPGWYVEPTLFEDVADDAYLSCNEVFGPAVSLYDFASFEDAIERCNAVDFGLSAAIFTADLRIARRFAAEVDAGMVHINRPTAGADVHVPFGGIKASSWGPHEQGRATIDFYTDTVTVYEEV